MSGLVNDMLRLARLDQHPGQQHEPVNVTALVTECAQRAQTTDPGHVWHADIARGLETAGDEELLRRAIDNLFANVSAHTPDGTVATVTATDRDGCVAIEISDNGPGVPPGQLPRIFERFYRAGAPSHRPGSGLGLAIVTAIATAHDGTVEAAQGDPHGLRITLALPACAQRGPAEPPAARIRADTHAGTRQPAGDSPPAPARPASPRPLATLATRITRPLRSPFRRKARPQSASPR